MHPYIPDFFLVFWGILNGIGCAVLLAAVCNGDYKRRMIHHIPVSPKVTAPGICRLDDGYGIAPGKHVKIARLLLLSCIDNKLMKKRTDNPLGKNRKTPI